MFLKPSPGFNWPPVSPKLIVALGIYLSSLFAANALGLKLMPFVFGGHLSVGVFAFPVVFIAIDVIGEVYGRPVAKACVLAGFVSTALFIFYSLVALAMPWSPDGEWARESYNKIFGVSTRISIASLVAFIVSEYQDVFSFFILREKWGVRHFWLRSFLSNLWSQFWDSAIFMLVAFAGIYPFKTMASIAVSWWLTKVAMGALYTPLSYVGLWLLRGEGLRVNQAMQEG